MKHGQPTQLRTRRSHTQRGFSTIELLRAVVVFGFLVVALVGALVYGRAASAGGGDRLRAVMLADEGSEAVRNIRDAAPANLVDGTYGLVQGAGQWSLSGISDKTDIFTRQVTVASHGNARKLITTTVSWPVGTGGTSQVEVVTELTNAGKADGN